MMEFARQLLDALPVTVFTVDLDGIVSGGNRAWSQLTEEKETPAPRPAPRPAGVPTGTPALALESTVRGQSIFTVIDDPDYAARLRQAMNLLRTGKATQVSWEVPRHSPDDSRVFLLQIAPLRDQRHVTGFVFSAVDITSSHRSREALIDSGLALSRPIDLDRLLHEVAQQARRTVRGDAVAVLLARDDTAANGAPNEAAADGAVLQLAYAIGYEQEAAALEERLRPLAGAAVAGGNVVVREVEQGVALAAPMRSAEGTIGAITLLIDGGRSRQELEEAQRVLATLAAQSGAAVERTRLVQRAGDQRRLEGIGEVATGIAHELRNPLFGISSAAQLLRFRAREDPVVEKNVGRILREVERLNHMVSALQEFGHPKPISLAPGDPDAVWDSVWEDQRGLLESRALALRRTRPPAPVACRIDPEQLAQVFANVLVNAVDHAPEGSDLTMTSRALPDGAWRLQLTNGGPAIPADVLPRVFDLFYSTRPGGTGVGLALCQRIVHEHHGEIGIESSPAAGTTVTITLPAAGR